MKLVRGKVGGTDVCAELIGSFVKGKYATP